MDLYDKAFALGRTKEVTDTAYLLRQSKAVGDNLETILKENNRLRAEVNRMGDLITQTQTDAYQLGLKHGQEGTDEEVS